jgi:hypothetical protein
VRCLGIIVLLVLSATGCTKKPAAIPMASFRTDYDTWNCRQLKEEADLLADALAVAADSRRADETVVHLKTETEAVRKASTSKGCGA